MQSRYFLSQFFTDEALNMRVPVCRAYGTGSWKCPTNPATDGGWALVQMYTSALQIEAAKQDPRVVVCPLLFDPSPVPQAVIDAYTSWGATSGMSMGALLTKLAAKEPVFAHSLS
jgi:hypothetical protein